MSETRWIPYDTEHLLDELPIDSTAAPPAKALSLAAPAYNKLSTTVEAPSHPDLGFMRNKHVMLSCRQSVTLRVQAVLINLLWLTQAIPTVRD